MDYSAAKEKLVEHGFDKVQPPLLLPKIANYVAKNYNLDDRVIAGDENQYDYGTLGTELHLLMSTIGGASEEVLNNVKNIKGKNDNDTVNDILTFFANHLDSSLLFALEGYENPELPLNEVVPFEDMENLTDDQVLPLLMEKIKSVQSPNNPKWLFNHAMSEKEWKMVQRHLKEINMDHCRRLMMLLLRLDVTVMSFFGAPRLEHLEDQLQAIHQEGESNFVIPKAAGICDLLVAGPSLLNIEKVKQNAYTRVTKYTLEEAPPTRGGTQRLQLSSGAADPSSASRGRHFYRGGGRRGRGHFRHQYSKREKEDLQSQVYEEIDRQLAEARGPDSKKRKRGKN